MIRCTWRTLSPCDHQCTACTCFSCWRLLASDQCRRNAPNDRVSSDEDAWWVLFANHLISRLELWNSCRRYSRHLEKTKMPTQQFCSSNLAKNDSSVIAELSRVCETLLSLSLYLLRWCLSFCISSNNKSSSGLLMCKSFLIVSSENTTCFNVLSVKTMP